MNNCPCKDCICYPICKIKIENYVKPLGYLYTKTFFQRINKCDIIIKYMATVEDDNYYKRKESIIKTFKLKVPIK